MADKEYDRDPGDDKDVTVLQWRLTKREWQTIAGLISDPKAMGRSHKEWREREDANEKKHRQKGYKIVRVDIDISGTLAWCKAERKPVDIKSFSKYSLIRHAKSGNAKARRTARSKR